MYLIASNRVYYYMSTIVMGLDPSIRSTGICIWDGEKHIYKLITSKATKKLQSIFPCNMVIHKDQKGLTGMEKELIKTYNVEQVLYEVFDILDEFKPEVLVMEGIAFGASGTIDQLAGLNYAIRFEARKRGIQVLIIPPTSLKHHTTGHGQSTKEVMIHLWHTLDPSMKAIKVDDLADAFHLCEYGIAYIDSIND